MADSTSAPEGFSLKRWSRRKLEAAQNAPAAPAAAAVPVAAPTAAVVTAPGASSTTAAAAAPVLPPVESLTLDSDFSAFMQPKVDELVKRAALKKLFTDPRFNVMDGLDIYVGDYTQPDPMPDGMLEKLGKVYAAVTHEDDADPQRLASTALSEAAPAESLPAPTAPAAPAPAATATVTADVAGAAPADPPASGALSSVPADPPPPAAVITPLATSPGKP